jgi:hypothetical protein
MDGPHLAVVSRTPASARDEYLILTPKGATLWTADLAKATIFNSMREAARAALRLPSGHRAFSLPLGSDGRSAATVH